MPSSPKWELVTDRWRGAYPLPDQLRKWHAAAVPAEAIARLITLDTGVKMNGETVRRWLRVLSKSAA